ncbi:sugar ABC transporter ATP-binding protein [Candidatus Formimonas warabiya]|uniref:Sugar ABC transporter ATP-binding protein n=1 Tax=Formimonas warabiya TaxID=1761012 RepID=A0A3G1KPK6_FORW1|nr:sugar ABC transporter ATP-binding protein [Candidatus Formimonas warabiya]ATW24403.1 sugar ABC transporter ATP-binding protein [Candidatus Formimonas warabiya]
MAGEDHVLSYDGVGKEFFGNRVLKNVTFKLGKGKILGLVGENGAGKSTMMKILFGMREISETGGYEGKIYFNGKEINFQNPMDALNAGIGMVHQEFSLIPGFTATENIMLNREITKTSVLSKILGQKLSTLDRPQMQKEAENAINSLDVKISPDMLIAEMPVGHKQFVEIAREIDRSQVQLLVLDEPTAVLTESEAEILLKAMKRLAAKGISIIFISHRLQEVIEVSDQIIVLRDGEIIKDISGGTVSIKEIAEWMVGREVSGRKEKRESAIDHNQDLIMEVENLWVDMPGELVHDVSLKIRRGEILGIGGLAGQGKLGIPNGIMGLFPAGGKVRYDGADLPLNSAKFALDTGLAFVSEDRRGVGLLLDEPIYWNISFSSMQVQQKYLRKVLGGLILWRDEKEMKKAAQEYIRALEIRCTGEKQKVRELSGGNQQKICLAKAFDLNPRILFVSEPTRGIDIGAKSLVLEALKRYNRENNTTIVMISSELEELRAICDRIAIVCEGKIAGILHPSVDAMEFGLLMAGVKAEGKKVNNHA